MLLVGKAILIVLLVGIGTVSVSADPLEWEVREGYELTVHSTGFRQPTAIVFPEVESLPYYLVTELGGTVKGVDKEGNVSVFLENFTPASYHPVREVPDEFGMAGICVSEEGDWIFVTYAYRDSKGIIRNGISKVNTYTKGVVPIDSVFEGVESGYGHQVGPCQVVGDQIYLAVGDGLVSSSSQDLLDPRGKVLRMDFNGEEVEVYASGLRNPFGLVLRREGEEVRERTSLFVADNGNSIDRFLRLVEGTNYLWDGTDFSLGLAGGVLLDSRGGTAAVDYVPEGYSPSPELEGRFLLVRTQVPPRIEILDYSMDSGGLRRPVGTLVRYRLEDFQIFSGMAIGPDGIYFAPLKGGQVLKIKETEGLTEHPYRIEPILSPADLVGRYGCQGCHILEGTGGSIGPNLDLVDKPEEYIVAFLQSPTGAMPDLGISESEARTLAELLLDSSKTLEQPQVSSPLFFRDRWTVVYFLLGIILGVGLVTFLIGIWYTIGGLVRK